MKKAFSFVLIAILLLCSCGTKNSEEYVDKRAYDECRALYLNYVSDTTNYEGHYLIFGDDGNGFIPISDLHEFLKFNEKKNGRFICNSRAVIEWVLSNCGEKYLCSLGK